MHQCIHCILQSCINQGIECTANLKNILDQDLFFWDLDIFSSQTFKSNVVVRWGFAKGLILPMSGGLVTNGATSSSHKGSSLYQSTVKFYNHHSGRPGPLKALGNLETFLVFVIVIIPRVGYHLKKIFKGA